MNISRFFNAGQAGLAAKRVYVFEEVYDAFMESLVKRVSHYELGDADAEGGETQGPPGPLNTARQRNEFAG